MRMSRNDAKVSPETARDGTGAYQFVRTHALEPAIVTCVRCNLLDKYRGAIIGFHEL